MVAAACAVGVPDGKPWVIDTATWAGAGDCAGDCALDAYATRDFAPDAVVPEVLRDGDAVQVHCFVPTPATHRDPSGREAYRWYLVTVEDDLLWAPDIALTSQVDLRLEPDAPGEHLAAGIDLCHSGVPGR